MLRSTSILLLLLLASCGPNSTVEEIRAADAPVAGALVDYQPAPQDWPNWRGPQRNGVAAGSAPVSWGPTEGVAWRSPVPGRGHGSPVIAGRLVLLSTANDEAQTQSMLAFDRDTGAKVWQTPLHEGGFPSLRELHQKGTNANGTVACDDERAYIAHLNAKGITASAVDFEGNLVWQTKLGDFSSKFGYAPSPIVYGPYVLFAADNWGGGYLAAVHRGSGEIAWRKKRSSTSTYSSPVIARVAGRDQLLISGNDEVSSYDPKTGDPIWACRGVSEATCGTMVWSDDVVYASGGYPDRQTIAVRADGSAEALWTNRVKVYEPSLLVVGDRLYGTTDRGVIYCWDRLTGEEHWRQRVGGGFSASPVFCDGRIYALNDAAEMLVFRDSAESYEELASNQVGDDAYASPAICDGKVFLRVGAWEGDTRQESLYCIAPTSKSEPPQPASDGA